MSVKYYLNKMQDVSLRDALAAFPMIASLVALPFLRNQYKDVWAICEREGEACDNGYHFFRYMCENHPEQKCIYYIDKKSKDYHKVSNLGKVQQFSSVKHWIAYFTCPYLISSQSFKPNGYLCTLLERLGLFRPAHVFLQHGITINRPQYLMADKRFLRYFITATPQETDDIRSHFGYPEDKVVMTGFARFDALHDAETHNIILVMPTWRKWLRLKSEKHEDMTSEVSSSEYVRRWRELLGSQRLVSLVNGRGLEVVLFVHQNMRELINTDSLCTKGIRCATEEEDLQQLMKNACLMITDYSSTFFDMAYMKKPVLFYQFDEEEFRKYHYPKGWFDYHTTSFGSWCANSNEVLAELEHNIENDFAVSDRFLAEHEETFPLYDSHNSQRIYELLSHASRVASGAASQPLSRNV